MSNKTSVQPKLTILSQEQIAQIHEYSVQILSSTGVRVDSARALALLSRTVGPSGIEGDRVRIPRDLVDWALQAAPSSIGVYDRNGNLRFSLPGQARFGIGVTALYYQDPATDQVEIFQRRHMAAMARVGRALPSFDVISTVGVVQDVPPDGSDLYGTLEMVANTDKPLIILVSEDGAFSTVLNLLEHLHGDLGDRPFVVPYLNPITPLVINGGTVDKMYASSERGLPFVYSNYGMAGASMPITPAGILALLNAELLAGLVLGQLIKEGTPMILGSLPAFFDMKGMGSFYDSISYLVGLACAEMMDHYGLPHAGTSGSGMGWGADIIASGHQWMNHLLSSISKVGLVPFVGDNLGSKALTPAIVVLANEIVAQVRRFARGFPLDDTSVVLDEIAQAGPGGNFLMSESTLQNFRHAYFKSDLFANLTLEDWQERGCPRAEEALRDHTLHLIQTAQPPEDHKELMAKGTAFIEKQQGVAGGSL